MFAAPQTINLTTGQMTITDSVTITGPGSGLLTVSGLPNTPGTANRIFTVSGTGTLDVTISGMTLTGGNLAGSPALASGAAILDGDETLTLDDVTLIIQDAKGGRYIDLSADYTDGYYRISFRPGPYNLFTSAAAHRSTLKALKADTVSGLPRWPFLAAADHSATIAGMAGSITADEITIPYREDISLVTYKYDAATRMYARWQNDGGKPVRDVDAVNKEPIAAANVVVLHTEIWEVPEIVDAAGSHAHDMRLVGTGNAEVFRDGQRQDATWTRASDGVAFTFTNRQGEQIKFNPGQTWIHIIPTEWTVSSK